mmetsp:Transcript_26913/g.63148  ORF Transcript_26913/g.63148 Transcript_26913/m.63148 type:complete len:449 (-) Transcript_26913:24-1370(-)
MPSCVRTTLCCWTDLLYGKACCLWNCVFAPCVLTFWSCAIYCCGCLRVYSMRCCGRWSGLFADPSFPANAATLGDVVEEVVWLRATRRLCKRAIQLVASELDPCQLCEGAQGDVWLLAAIAILGEHRGALQQLFDSTEFNPRGRYVVKLFDGIEERWRRIVVDDRIPCQRAAYENSKLFRPIGLQTKELFPLLIEKAFAKLCGSYSRLRGCSTAWALRALTGQTTRIFVRGNESWDSREMEDELDSTGKRSFCLLEADSNVSDDVFFDVLRRHCLLQSLVCAAGASPETGLKAKHAYSILQLERVSAGTKSAHDRRFVKMRDAWESSWQGAWSRRSARWANEPEVRQHLDFHAGDASTFWMSWDEFLQTWRTVAVVERPTSIRALHFEVIGDSFCDPAAACLLGCASFWAGEGCQRLYSPDARGVHGETYSLQATPSLTLLGKDMDKE